MKEEDLFYVLALLKVEGIGDIIAKKLLKYFGSAEAVFKAKPDHLIRIEGVGSMLLKNIKQDLVFKKAEIELKYIKVNNIRVFYFKDEDYPDRLKHCIDGPVLLFASGSVDLKNKKIISIVGTRQITAYGTDFCKKLICDLAPLNPVIVSGFAYGVDIMAHQAAIENNLQTIGVLGHGLSQIYPKEHKKYIARVKENGGFITDFWSSSTLERKNFVKRNRIVAGISEATIVVESAAKGGSLITANIASDYNRDVFAVPGRINDKYSEGCNMLIKTQKANAITSAMDLIYMMNWKLEKPIQKPIQKQLFITLEQEEKKIYNFLQKSGRTLLDTIAIQCELPVYRVYPILLSMELKGVIKPIPGKLFEAV